MSIIINNCFAKASRRTVATAKSNYGLCTALHRTYLYRLAPLLQLAVVVNSEIAVLVSIAMVTN